MQDNQARPAPTNGAHEDHGGERDDEAPHVSGEYHHEEEIGGEDHHEVEVAGGEDHDEEEDSAPP